MIEIDYKQKIAEIHRELGIPENYENSCGLALQSECQQLVNTELDVFSRQPLLDVAAFDAWQTMQMAARAVKIDLQIISAFRSVGYQRQILLNKLAKGQSLDQILKVNAAPGYSEHHTGQALDIGCPDFEHLNEDFDQSPAFAWLVKNAKNHRFSLSFPKSNMAGIIYEPWHWKFS